MTKAPSPPPTQLRSIYPNMIRVKRHPEWSGPWELFHNFKTRNWNCIPTFSSPSKPRAAIIRPGAAAVYGKSVDGHPKTTLIRFLRDCTGYYILSDSTGGK